MATGVVLLPDYGSEDSSVARPYFGGRLGRGATGPGGLAQSHGVNPVARALRLNYAALRQRTLAGRAPVPAGKPSAGFVEVAVPPWPVGVPCSIELEDRRGAKLTVRLGCAEATTVLAVAQGLWRHRP